MIKIQSTLDKNIYFEIYYDMDLSDEIIFEIYTNDRQDKKSSRVGKLTIEHTMWYMINTEPEFVDFYLPLDLEDDDDVIEIKYLEIENKYKQNGYGSILMDFALDWLFENFTHTKLYILWAKPYGSGLKIPQDKLIEFYESFGFAVNPYSTGSYMYLLKN